MAQFITIENTAFNLSQIVTVERFDSGEVAVVTTLGEHRFKGKTARDVWKTFGEDTRSAKCAKRDYLN